MLASTSSPTLWLARLVLPLHMIIFWVSSSTPNDAVCQQTFHALAKDIPDLLKMSDGGRDRQMTGLLFRAVMDLSLIAIIFYHGISQKLLYLMTEQSSQMSSEMSTKEDLVWEHVKVRREPACASLELVQFPCTHFLPSTSPHAQVTQGPSEPLWHAHCFQISL